MATISPFLTCYALVLLCHTQVTRFCLICNYVTRIIEPLASRCAKFRFSALGQGAMLDRLRYISQEEDVSVHPAMVCVIPPRLYSLPCFPVTSRLCSISRDCDYW